MPCKTTEVGTAYKQIESFLMLTDAQLGEGQGKLQGEDKARGRRNIQTGWWE